MNEDEPEALAHAREGRDDLRARWREYWSRHAAISRAHDEDQQRWWALATAARQGKGPWPGEAPRAPALPPVPAEFRGLACGARTRMGQPCKRTDLMRNGRCKFHGGMSSGPKTAAGRKRAAANLALGRVKKG